ncbi:type II toxin-antitoxin system Phd/YefM family antitoxin [Litchfieldella rifensis]|uniref:Type II toxin-antitoxin system Phd/YefM family antitoxin n=1 Tax=Litchfieldella rifensis TaxID=762643 RepID=A0ABV7LV76_9GAMM
MQATTKDLRLRTRELLAATARGEEVVITYRGKRCVKLVAYEEATTHRISHHQRNPAFGLWRDRNETSVNDEVRKLRQPRHFTPQDDT